MRESKSTETVAIPYCGTFAVTSQRDRENARTVIDFINSSERAFERDPRWDHITASAFVLNSARDHVLLTRHAKLGRWLQLGGHCDGIRDPRFVAMKEAYEESGLTRLQLIHENIFDIDIHDIPAIADMPKHRHLDIRYLLEGDMSELLRATAESTELAWVKLNQLDAYSTMPSVLVVKQKTMVA